MKNKRLPYDILLSRPDTALSNTILNPIRPDNLSPRIRRKDQPTDRSEILDKLDCGPFIFGSIRSWWFGWRKRFEPEHSAGRGGEKDEVVDTRVSGIVEAFPTVAL